MSSSCVPNNEYFCGFVRIRIFGLCTLRRHKHVIPQHIPDTNRKQTNTPITTYKIDQSEIKKMKKKRCLVNVIEK